ncbi:MAG: phosphatidate cytidylyltransferase [Eubacteriales bacterium]
MKQRIITGIIFAALVLTVLFLSHTFVYIAVITLLSVIGTGEMLKCIGVWKNPLLSVPSLIYAAACPLLAMEYRYGVLMATTLAFLFLLLMLLVFAHEKVRTESVCTAFTMVVYITICFVCLIRLRYVTTEVGTNAGRMVGQYLYLLVFIAAWVTDTFAYFTGVFFGKHKLCPNISPKKTVEGSLGGIVFCIVAFLIYGTAISRMFSLTPNYLGLAVIGLLMSVLAQVGDLLASVIKRTYGVKDYGKLFPGHGGVLDRFDSVLLLAPFLLAFVEDAQFLQFFFSL